MKRLKAIPVVICLLLATAASSAASPAAQTAPAAEIHQAAKQGDLAKVKSLLDKAPGLLEMKTEAGKTALHFAVEGGHADVVRYLLDRARTSTAETSQGKRPCTMRQAGDSWT